MGSCREDGQVKGDVEILVQDIEFITLDEGSGMIENDYKAWASYRVQQCTEHNCIYKYILKW